MRNYMKLFILSWIVVLVGCGSVPPKPENFAFVFRYGVSPPREMLDTYRWEYTRGITEGRDTVVSFRLTGDQMDSIYYKMMEINVFGYPEEFVAQNAVVLMPHRSYLFKIRSGNMEKRIRWDGGSGGDKAKKLTELIRLIEGMIKSNKQYSLLPPSQFLYF
jgi:hypothetical protein